MGKYLSLVAGKIREITALVTSTGAADAGKIIQTDSGGRIDSSLMPVGFGDDAKIMTASEILAAGDFVNVFDDSGTVKVRKADASAADAGKLAHGFVLDGAAAEATVKVYFEGINNGVTGLTAGAMQYLSATPGAATATAPSAAAYTVQEVGPALSATEISFEPSKAVILADA